MPRGVPGSGSSKTAPRARSGTQTTTAAHMPRASGQQTIWQGASLNGLYIFRLVRNTAGWQLYCADIGTATTLAFKAVTTPALYLEAFAALGTMHAAMFLPGVGARPANRSIPRDATNAIPLNGVKSVATAAGNNAGSTSTAQRRARSRVSVQRSPATAAVN